MINNQYERPIKFHFHYRVLLIDSVKTLSIYLGSLVHRCRMTPAYFSLTCPALSVLHFVFGCILVFFSISCISLFWQEALLPHVDSSRAEIWIPHYLDIFCGACLPTLHSEGRCLTPGLKGSSHIFFLGPLPSNHSRWGTWPKADSWDIKPDVLLA